jgi:uncharacterized coiled-coil protein SlyX
MDLANQRAQIRDLLMKLDEQAEEVAALEEAARAMRDRLHETQERNSALVTRITELEKRQDFREEMLEFMKHTLAQHAPDRNEEA